MKRFDDFAQTLEKKIRQQIESEFFADAQSALDESSGILHDELPLSYAWLLGQSENLRAQTAAPVAKGHARYGVKAKPLPAYTLSEEESQAKNEFQLKGIELSPRFRPEELRSAWRRLARATHPDFGGESETFIRAEAAYRILQAFFTKKAA